jgi:hypothetical protein
MAASTLQGSPGGRIAIRPPKIPDIPLYRIKASRVIYRQPSRLVTQLGGSAAFGCYEHLEAARFLLVRSIIYALRNLCQKSKARMKSCAEGWPSPPDPLSHPAAMEVSQVGYGWERGDSEILFSFAHHHSTEVPSNWRRGSPHPRLLRPVKLKELPPDARLLRWLTSLPRLPSLRSGRGWGLLQATLKLAPNTPLPSLGLIMSIASTTPFMGCGWVAPAI